MLIRRGKYVFDPNRLQFKKIKRTISQKVRTMGAIFILSIGLAIGYGFLFNHFLGSPKEKRLNEKIEGYKLQLAFANKAMDESMEILENIILDDETIFRPVLEMEELPESFRNPGVGGVERYSELNGYSTSYLMKETRGKADRLKNMLKAQESSFDEIVEKEEQREDILLHTPSISPVMVTIKKGDGLMLRQVHPVLGVTQYHNGLDFRAPIGTEVYAPADGQVILVGRNGGYGMCVIIDHGYGYKTIYGHLSSYNVSVGQNVKRGDLICWTGNTGVSTGPHLHYEIRQYDVVKNPVLYMHDNLSVDEYREMIAKFSRSY